MEASHTTVLRPLLRNVRKVVITAHLNPDGDAVAGLLALCTSLRLARWEVQPILPSPFPSGYRFLSGWESVAVYSSDTVESPEGARARNALMAAEAIFCLDASDVGRLGAVYAHHASKFETTPVINVDHHPTNTRYGSANLVDPSAAAVCEMLTLIMEQEDLPINEEVAFDLLVGIVADTLNFRTPATTARTMRAAAGLMERGASLSQIAERVFNTRSPRTLRLWGRVLSRARVEDGLVWADITSEMLDECQATLEDADHLVDFIAGVPDARAAFLFSEQQGKVRVSMRTSGDLDAAALARSFGGGGHVRAAGCTVEGSMDEVQARLMSEARRRLAAAAETSGRQNGSS